jgi:hypothetical protein
MIPALIDLLGASYQMGNLQQVEVIARSMLSAIPDDLVALQFLALVLHQRGRIMDAYLILRRAAERQERQGAERYVSTGEPAAAASYREATRFGSLLAGGWKQVSQLMAHYGFKAAAAHALQAALAATTDRRATLRSVA